MRCGNVVWGGSVASHGEAEQLPKEILGRTLSQSQLAVACREPAKKEIN